MTRFILILATAASIAMALFMAAMMVAGVANAEDDTLTIHVTAHVIGMVCTVDSPMEECQDAAVVARLAEDDEVVVEVGR